MPLTFLQLKTAVRQRVFPAGESRNLRPPHDKSIVDALVDLQRWVDCLQSNNTHLIPHCATNYNCGLTSFDFPRSRIMRLSVIDKINPETHEEDADAADDYCTEIEYQQIDPCHMRSYLGKSRSSGCCLSFSQFFAIPAALCGGKGCVPVPTDEDVPVGLPILPLGYHYPQESTDATCGRAMSGVWAVEHGRVLVAPWIQSTETIVLKWEGIKREWVDADLVDDDPGLLRAVEMFLRWEHARDWDKDPQTGAGYEVEYRKALADLMYDCAQENMVRSCASERDMGAGGARGIAPVVKLYFNDALPAVVEQCPGNTTGPTVVEPIEAGTVASSKSVDDANQLAVAAAHTRAQARLNCTPTTTTYKNRAVSAVAMCPAASGDTPAAEGQPRTVSIAAGDSRFDSTVSEDDAAATAQAFADAEAASQLTCTFWNAPQSYTAVCAADSNDNVTITIGAHEFSSTISQADANSLAYNEAKRQADVALVGSCGGSTAVFYSVEVEVFNRNYKCPGKNCYQNATVVVLAGARTGQTQQEADDAARAYANVRLGQFLDDLCSRTVGGTHSVACRLTGDQRNRLTFQY